MPPKLAYTNLSISKIRYKFVKSSYKELMGLEYDKANI